MPVVQVIFSNTVSYFMLLYPTGCPVRFMVVVKLSSFDVDSSATHVLYRKNEIDIDSLRVRSKSIALSVFHRIRFYAYSSICRHSTICTNSRRTDKLSQLIFKLLMLKCLLIVLTWCLMLCLNIV